MPLPLVVLLATALQQDKVSFEERLLAKIPNDVQSLWLPRWASTGRGVVYAGEKGGKRFVVDPRGKGEDFEEVWRPVIGFDGKVSAYSAKRAGKHYLVVAGKKSEPYDEIEWDPVMSPDGKTVMCWAQLGTQRVL